MGSDSRTATASSKPRPSWRDRHLNQLSDEQLAEVKQHRGNESVAEMAGIESHTSGTSDEASKLPQEQAGPERRKERQKEHRKERQHENRTATENPGSRYVEDRPRDAYRSGTERQDSRDSRSYAHSDQRDRFRSERTGQQDQRPDRIRRERRPEEGYIHREEAQRTESRAYHETEHVAPLAGSADSTQSDLNKGFVARVLDFKMSAPVKYGLMAFAIAVMVAVSLLKPIDHSSESQLDSAFTRAAIGFGLAKTLNGVISVAQGTEFAVQPAGVGVNFSPGEILDPINDLVERFSLVMLVATSSIGIQQILLKVSSWSGISVMLAGAGLFFLLTRLRNSSLARMADVAGKLLLVMLLVRFLIPIGSLANDWVYKQFLQPQYEASSAELEVASDRIREINTRQTEASESDGSLTDRAKQFYSSMTSKFDFDGMLDDYKQSAETVSENAINLIVVFVLQTIIFPLLFMYLIYRLFRFALLPSGSSRS